MNQVVKVKPGQPPDAIYRGLRRRFVVGQGWTTVSIYQFTTLMAAQAFAGQAAQAGNNVEVEEMGAPYVVEVGTAATTDASDEQPYDVWEVPPITSEKSLFEHPVFQALSEDEQLSLREWFANQSAEQSPAVSSPGGFAIYDLLRRGTESFQSGTASVRYTRTVSNRFTALGSTYVNTGRIWTTASLLTLSPPALVSAAISAAANGLPAPVTGYAQGWLKQQPTITQRGVARFDITHEWWLENWSTTIYGVTV